MKEKIIEEKVFEAIMDMAENGMLSNEDNIETVMQKLEEAVTAPKPLKIKNIYINNSLVCREICKLKNIARGSRSLEVKTMPRNGEDGIVCVEVEYRTADVGESEPVSITMWDKAVMDAVYTLVKNGYVVATSQMIARVMNGSTEQHICRQKVEKVENSLNKLGRLFVRIDASNEFYTRDVEMGGVLEGYLFNYQKVEITKPVNREKVDAWFLSPTVLYLYASAIKQIINAPFEYRQTQDVLKNRDDVIIVRDYLICRIENMKNSKNRMRSNYISYEWYDKENERVAGMFADLGIYPKDYSNWKKKKGKIDTVVEALLEEFKAKGIIDNYIKRTNDGVIGRKNLGYEIVV